MNGLTGAARSSGPDWSASDVSTGRRIRRIRHGRL